MPRPQERNWCDYCKIFLGKGQADVQHHERGWRHKNNVHRYLKAQLSARTVGKIKSKAPLSLQQKREREAVREKELINFETGFYVADGRPYLEGNFHVQTLRNMGTLLTIEAIWPEEDDWYPANIAADAFCAFGNGITSILVNFPTQSNSTHLIPLTDIRIPVAPPPPPRKKKKVDLKHPGLDEGFLQSAAKDVVTGLGVWTVTRVCNEEFSKTDLIRDISCIKSTPKSKRSIEQSDDESDELSQAFVPQNELLDDAYFISQNNAQVTVIKNHEQDKSGLRKAHTAIKTTLRNEAPKDRHSISFKFKKRKGNRTFRKSALSNEV
jgi:hypothetical protein|eukprot:Stramenopile-MAST_4_protein_2869